MASPGLRGLLKGQESGPDPDLPQGGAQETEAEDGEEKTEDETEVRGGAPGHPRRSCSVSGTDRRRACQTLGRCKGLSKAGQMWWVSCRELRLCQPHLHRRARQALRTRVGQNQEA